MHKQFICFSVLSFLAGFGGLSGRKLSEPFRSELHFVPWKHFLLGFSTHFSVNNEYPTGLTEVLGGKVSGSISGTRDVSIWFELFVVLHSSCKRNGAVEPWDEDLSCSGITSKRYSLALAEVGLSLFLLYIQEKKKSFLILGGI